MHGWTITDTGDSVVAVSDDLGLTLEADSRDELPGLIAEVLYEVAVDLLENR